MGPEHPTSAIYHSLKEHYSSFSVMTNEERKSNGLFANFFVRLFESFRIKGLQLSKAGLGIHFD